MSASNAPAIDLTHRVAKIGAYSCSLLKSGLQKAVRYGMYAKCKAIARLYLHVLDVEAGEVHAVKPEDPKKQVSAAKGQFTNFLNRIHVMVLEDVAPGDPRVLVEVSGRLAALDRLRDDVHTTKGRHEYLRKQVHDGLFNVLEILCRCYHGRLPSHLKACAALGKSVKKRYAPSFEFLSAALAEKPEDGDEDEDGETAKTKKPKVERVRVPPSIRMEDVDLKRWERHIQGKESFLVPVMAALYPNPSASRGDTLSWKRETEEEDDNDKDLSLEDFLASPAVTDVHTPEGKRLKESVAFPGVAEGLVRFALFGSVVRDDQFRLGDAGRMQNIYLADKLKLDDLTLRTVMKLASSRELVARGTLSEKRLFGDVCRVQVTCSALRPDSYLALMALPQALDYGDMEWFYDREGLSLHHVPVFVKGPFRKSEVESLRAEGWVHKHLKAKMADLSSLRPHIFELEPDMWNTVPLGSRNDTKTRSSTFVVYESLIPIEGFPIPTHPYVNAHRAAKKPKGDGKEVKESAWNGTPLANAEHLAKYCPMPEPETMDTEGRVRTLMAVLWRHVAAVPDNAQRNLIHDKATGKVYSIDEHNLLHKDPSPFRWKQSTLDVLVNVARSEWQRVRTSLQQWVGLFESIDQWPSVFDRQAPMDRLQALCESPDAIARLLTKPAPKKQDKSAKKHARSDSDDEEESD